MWSGVVPQQPPAMSAPRSIQRAARAAYSAGVRTGVTGQPESGSTSPMCAYAPKGNPESRAASSARSTPWQGTQLISAAAAPDSRAAWKKRPRSSPLFIAPPGVAIAATQTGSPVDRKSTRLNSSHQIISYAVFCLKKKKETHEREVAKYLQAVATGPSKRYTRWALMLAETLRNRTLLRSITKTRPHVDANWT